MPLTINLRHLERQALHLHGELPSNALDIGDMDELVQMLSPVFYDLWAEKLQRSVLVRGQLRFVLDCQCARCLRPIQKDVEITDWSCNLALDGEEKVAVENDGVDLTPFIREDILLAFPQHPLCQTECSGLPMATQPYPNAGETRTGEAVPSAWDELNKLRF